MAKNLSGHLALAKFTKMCEQSKTNTILDIGAGKTEPHASQMRGAGLKVETCDLFPISTHQGNYNEHEFAESFDAIWCSHVLEHQMNVNDFLKKVHRDVKEGGVVAITVPPLKQNIVGGHVSLWNGGLLLYNMVLAGFDCSNAMIKKYGYNISVIVRKKSFTVPHLTYDTYDLDKLRSHFPREIFPSGRVFNGNIEEHNWK